MRHYLCLAKGSYQTVQSYLPPCYFHQHDPAGVETVIFKEWANNWLEETAHLRKGGKYLAMIFDR